MQFSDSANKLGIVEDTDFLVGTDSTKYSTANKTRNINERFRLIWTMIFEAYGGWRFMDDNVSDTSTGVPYADQDITSGTGLYALPTGALTIDGVEIRTSVSGPLQKLTPITHEQFLELGGDGYFASNGTPTHYLPQGDVLRLLPTPNFNMRNGTEGAYGMRVFFDQGISAFAATDTTKTPGFASPFHRMLSVGAALDYALLNGMSKKIANLSAIWNDYERRLKAFYSKRYKERYPNRITPGEDLVDEYR